MPAGRISCGSWRHWRAAVSPYPKGEHVVHSYNDHVSILKFIDRNRRLKPLSGRSRDNLPNPGPARDNPYVPTNSPPSVTCSICSISAARRTADPP
jgi:hypothetical protein